MDKKGATQITVVFWVIAFVIIWFMFAGKFLNIGVGMAIENNNLTGIEAFLLSNLNLIIFFCVLIFIVAYGYITQGE